ncbi:MAG: hypothetical protein J07HN4v3_02029 [Halonotius sp. J07HN4]|jgi:hypothetical protein|nr:MAG: hypothetical protein J07HN4v3_02029 [Halonotius sp. J07HN4]
MGMLRNPIFRWGVGGAGAIVVAAIAFLVLDGTAQLVAYFIAAMDLIVTPQILKRAAEG